MPRKPDLEEIRAIADEFGMDDEARRDFGDYVEDCKRHGDRGTKNNRGDFTKPELRGKAREFLGLPDAD